MCHRRRILPARRPLPFVLRHLTKRPRMRLGPSSPYHAYRPKPFIGIRRDMEARQRNREELFWNLTPGNRYLEQALRLDRSLVTAFCSISKSARLFHEKIRTSCLSTGIHSLCRIKFSLAALAICEESGLVGRQVYTHGAPTFLGSSYANMRLVSQSAPRLHA